MINIKLLLWLLADVYCAGAKRHIPHPVKPHPTTIDTLMHYVRFKHKYNLDKIKTTSKRSTW